METKNKTEYIGSIVCTGASVDQETNNLSIFNMIEEISIFEKQLQAATKDGNKERVAPLSFELVTLWRKNVKNEGISAQEKIELLDPDDKILQKIEHPILMKSEHKRLRNRIKISGFKITAPGDYTFRIYIKEGDAKDYRFGGETKITVNILKDGELKNIKSVA